MFNNIRKINKFTYNAQEKWFNYNFDLLKKIGAEIYKKDQLINEKNFNKSMVNILKSKNMKITGKQCKIVFDSIVNLEVDKQSVFTEKSDIEKVNKDVESSSVINNIKPEIKMVNKNILTKVIKINNIYFLIIVAVLLLFNLAFLIYRNSVVNDNYKKKVEHFKNKLVNVEKGQEFLKGKISQLDYYEKQRLQNELENLQRSIEELKTDLENTEYYEWYEE
jgi:hypothetical protein